jgi:aspartate/methionine/tyrosine aminotransferase
MTPSPKLRERQQISLKAQQYTESVIRGMSRLAAEHKAVNLAQGMPDFPCPVEIKEAGCNAINADINQYAITWGDKAFRDAIAEKTAKYSQIKADPETEITVVCGATEGMIASMLALVDTGDEVIIFEPFYENYGADAILAGATPRYVTLHPPHWHFDEKELEAAFSNRTRAIILNTPHNPTGKVFTREEIECIGKLCQKWGVKIFTDEPYEHIVFDNAKHIAPACLPGMREMVVTINSLSKTYSITGWRLGTVIAAPELTSAIRKVHDFLTVGAAAPLQRAGALAMRLPDSYYDKLAKEYQQRRELMLKILEQSGLDYNRPQGAYYVLSDISKFGFADDVKFTEFLVKEIGVAVVPGSSFFRPNSEIGRKYIRFCFAKKQETLEAAGQRLIRLKDIACSRG